MEKTRDKGRALPPLSFLRFLVDEARATLRRDPDDETAARILSDAIDEARERFDVELGAR